MASDAIETTANDLLIAPMLFPIMAAHYTTGIGQVKSREVRIFGLERAAVRRWTAAAR